VLAGRRLTVKSAEALRTATALAQNAGAEAVFAAMLRSSAARRRIV
jgi:hypothetical protein